MPISAAVTIHLTNRIIYMCVCLCVGVSMCTSVVAMFGVDQCQCFTKPNIYAVCVRLCRRSCVCRCRRVCRYVFRCVCRCMCRFVTGVCVYGLCVGVF